MDSEMLEIAAALVEGSIGFYTGRAALLTAERFLSGAETDGSERCVACYGGDLKRMVSADLRYFNGISDERKRAAREFVLATKDWNWLEATTASLLHPTHGP